MFTQVDVVKVFSDHSVFATDGTYSDGAFTAVEFTGQVFAYSDHPNELWDWSGAVIGDYTGEIIDPKIIKI